MRMYGVYDEPTWYTIFYETKTWCTFFLFGSYDEPHITRYTFVGNRFKG